jgi:sensor histidine kinase YesM
LVAAVLYAFLWVSAVSAIFTVLATIEKNHLTFVFLRSFALQWELFSGLMIYATLSSITYVLQITVDLREEERRLKEMELRAAQAEALQTQTELAALRAKLNPHFLFNTLHTLMALVRDDRAEAELAIEHFSSMLRYILRWGTDGGTREVDSRDTTLADEWGFVQDYFALERLRLGDRLNVEIKIDPAVFDALLPPLTLQPLIENAIKHSIAPRAKGGTVSIAASVRAGELIVDVSDDGCGATRDQVENSSGLGLRLIAKTLSTQYDERAQLHIETSPHQGFTVRLKIPQAKHEPPTFCKEMESEASEDIWSFEH